MGRLRRERKKFHLKAVGPKTGNELKEKSRNESEAFVNKIGLSSPKWQNLNISDSIFSGINISLDNLKVPAEISDAKSVCKSAGYEESGNRISKKSKMKLRRQNFLAELESLHRALKEKKNKLDEKKASKMVPWDMNPLVSALPTSEELDNIKEKKRKNKSRKKRSTQKAHVRQKDWLANIEAFKSTLRNSTIMSNPVEISNIVIKNFEITKTT